MGLSRKRLRKKTAQKSTGKEGHSSPIVSGIISHKTATTPKPILAVKKPILKKVTFQDATGPEEDSRIQNQANSLSTATQHPNPQNLQDVRDLISRNLLRSSRTHAISGSVPAWAQCTDPACPVQPPHYQTNYFHPGQLRKGTRFFPNGNPPPEIWEAFDRCEDGEGSDADREAVRVFRALHCGKWTLDREAECVVRTDACEGEGRAVEKDRKRLLRFYNRALEEDMEVVRKFRAGACEGDVGMQDQKRRRGHALEPVRRIREFKSVDDRGQMVSFSMDVTYTFTLS